MTKPTLHLMVGLPGSGKSTLSQIIHEQTGARHLSSDITRLELFPEPTFNQTEHDELYQHLDRELDKTLANGDDAIYDANLNRRVHREEKYELARKYGANVILWWLCTDDNLSKERRISDQNPDLLPDGESSDKMFDRIKEVFEYPDENELAVRIEGVRLKKDPSKVTQALQRAHDGNHYVRL